VGNLPGKAFRAPSAPHLPVQAKGGLGGEENLGRLANVFSAVVRRLMADSLISGLTIIPLHTSGIDWASLLSFALKR
jgi:hypothetical protein